MFAQALRVQAATLDSLEEKLQTAYPFVLLQFCGCIHSPVLFERRAFVALNYHELIIQRFSLDIRLMIWLLHAE